MAKQKRTCERLKKACTYFFKFYDFFGTPFSFKNKSKEKYSTVLGGIVFTLFYFISLVIFEFNIIPFIGKKYFTLQYYTTNLNYTEEINLEESKIAFAVGLTCGIDSITNLTAEELFDLNLAFISKTKFSNGTAIINKKNVPMHSCRKDDFYNLHNDSFDFLNIKEYKCLDKEDIENNSLKGIFTDEKFSYYEFTVKSKYEDNETHFKNIDDYLIQNDCKLHFYYTDITANMSNYIRPFKSFINSLFLQINPILIQKKNIFFKNYHLINQTKFLHIFETKDEKALLKTGFSRVEDYSIYKGLNRYSQKSPDYINYAKIYIRADNKKVEIKRKYQDFMEFWAGFLCLCITMLFILSVFLSPYERLNANHSLAKELFFFEGIESNHFKGFKKLKELINSNLEKEIQINNVNVEDINQIPTYTRRRFVNNFIRNDTNSNLVNIDKKKEEKLINFSSYNLNEMIGNSFCCCCYKSKKRILISQYNRIIDNKLDISLYIRNMILLDLINQTLFKNKTIINFLSSPIIYFYKTDKIFEEEDFFRHSNEFYLYNLYIKIKELIEKPEKTTIEKEIISLLEQKLKSV